jgi:hypothetical protein
MKGSLAVILVSAGLALAPGGVNSAELKVAPGDNVESVLAAQKGKKVTVRLRSGQETTGTVTMVSAKLVQLAAVAGKEFFDAVVPLEAIEAVFVRTKD